MCERAHLQACRILQTLTAIHQFTTYSAEFQLTGDVLSNAHHQPNCRSLCNSCILFLNTAQWFVCAHNFHIDC